ncbi:MAG: helix-turn-helix domain-containing protein, partial [Gammaproteobacteria bacterium]|nr:helix-turn-helix domain-containing protein [Gammaproteobacteria bacterium]
MLNQELLVEIHVLHRQGHSIRAISRQLGISRNTVRNYLGDRARSPSYGPCGERPSKLDPFKFYLQERITAAKPYWIPATVLFREIKAQGFTGQEG